jgi:hypothetical protein
MQDHFIIAALGEEVYEWGVIHGLPIFKPRAAFNSDNFNSVTKLQSSIVLEVLQAGYSAGLIQ